MNDEIEYIEEVTFKDYGAKADTFWQRTKDHDVSQNYAAFLAPFGEKSGLDILDLGCGPGRDITFFKELGHNPVGLDGTAEFCQMARDMTGCPILEQSFNDLDLEKHRFDGVFANASMFHVPSHNLSKVLDDLFNCLRPGGILFTSNPRGDVEGWQDTARYGNFMEFDRSKKFLNAAGFSVLDHYYRPPNLPREEQKWLAMVCRAEGEKAVT